MWRAVTVFIVVAVVTVAGGWTHGVGEQTVLTNQFTSLHLGGGGWVVGQDVSITGVRFARTDVGGGYIWDTTNNQWMQLLCASCIPANATSNAMNFGYYPTTGSSQKYQGSSAGGVVEIADAPSNSAYAYLNYGGGHILQSTNVNPSNTAALTWTDIANGSIGSSDTSNGSCRMDGRAMAVDPANASHLIVATQSQGIWEWLSGSWTQITAETFGSNPLIAFDPTSAVVGGLQQTLYIFAQGTGTYVATNVGTAGSAAGASWGIAAASGPTSAQHMVVNGDSTSGHNGGDVWIVDGSCGGSGGLWRLSGGTWTHSLATNNYHAVAVNPNDGLHVVAIKNGGHTMAVSTASSPSFSVYTDNKPTATDAPWQVSLGSLGSLTAGDINFDPLQIDVLLYDGGQGFWTSPMPTSGPTGAWTWNSMVFGIEELEDQQIVVPAAYSPVIGAQDEAGCRFNAATNIPPSSCIPINVSQTLTFASGLASAPSTPLFTVAKISNDFGSVPDSSGYSTDGFASTYFPFNAGWVVTVSPASLSNSGGLVSVTIPASPGTGALTSWSAGANSIVCARVTAQEYASGGGYVSNGVNGQCYPVTVNSSTSITLQNSTWASDLTDSAWTAYQLWALPTTMLSTNNGQYTITNVQCSGGSCPTSGSVEVTVAFSFADLTNNVPFCITGVQMTGATVVNGCWFTQSVSGTSFLLGPTSSWSGGDSYVTGGVGSTWQPPGGSIAAASTTNISMIPENNSYPSCSTNGGQTWAQVNYAGIPPAVTTVTGGPYSAGATSVTIASASGISTPVAIALADGRNLYTSITLAGTTMTLTTSVPPGASIANGASVSKQTGWGFADYLQQYSVAADWVTPNTFYAVNYLLGLLTWTNCGSPTLVNNDTINSGSGSWQYEGGFNSKLKTVPGQAGHLFYTVGPVGGGTSPHGTGLWRSCDGGTTMVRVPNVFEPQVIGLGVAAPGQSYQAIYFGGWIDLTGGNGAHSPNYLFSIWRSNNDLNNGASGACNVGGPVTASISGTNLAVTALTQGNDGYSLGVGDVIVYSVNGDVTAGTTITALGTNAGGPCSGGSPCNFTVNNSQNRASEAMVLSANTWTNICNQASPTSQCFPGTPSGWLTTLADISGDPFVYGPVYVSTGMGAFAGKFNFLLNRDLDPASNDNSPVGLDRAA